MSKYMVSLQSFFMKEPLRLSKSIFEGLMEGQLIDSVLWALDISVLESILRWMPPSLLDSFNLEMQKRSIRFNLNTNASQISITNVER